MLLYALKVHFSNEDTKCMLANKQAPMAPAMYICRPDFIGAYLSLGGNWFEGTNGIVFSTVVVSFENLAFNHQD